MPGMKENEFPPRIDDLPEGTELKIVHIGDNIKTNYDKPKVVVTFLDGTQLEATGLAVVNKLIECRDDEEYVYSKEDPISCKVTKYQSHGKTCTSLGPA
jgi:hypothetical protein